MNTEMKRDGNGNGIRGECTTNDLVGRDRLESKIKSSESIHQATGVVVESTLTEAMTVTKPCGVVNSATRGGFATNWVRTVE